MKNEKEYFIYAYQPPTDGTNIVDGTTYYQGKDFRTVKRFKEYKAVGFNCCKVSSNVYRGEPYETCEMKKFCDVAYKAGLKRAIIVDYRITHLGYSREPVVGSEENALFKTEQELDAQIAEWVAPYRNEPWFFGVQMADEVKCDAQLESLIAVANSLKRVIPDVYIHANHLAMGPEETGENQVDVANKFFDKYLDGIGKVDMLTDPYPFRRDYLIYGYTVTSHQIIAKKCRERGLDMHVIFQAFSCFNGNHLIWRHITERDMYWQINLALGFGVRGLAFYSYFPKSEVDYKKGWGEIDGVCMMNHDGSRTQMYYYVKRILSEVKKFGKIHLKYSFKQDYIVIPQGKTLKDYDATELALETPACPLNIAVDGGVAIVTEQDDGDDALFMIENVDNIIKEYRDKISPMRVSLDLRGYKPAFYRRAKRVKLPRVNGVYEFTLPIGEAVFFEIKGYYKK